jgi:CRP-like cAMP-binding protein
MQTEEISWLCAVFRKIDMFSSLTVAEVTDLIDHMEKYSFSKGSKIVRQGDKGDSFFIIYKGKVRALVKKGFFSSTQVGELGPEQFFGEMALLSNEPRSATVVAVDDTECFMLLRGDFEQLVRKNPAFSRLVQRASQKRSFDNNQQSA